MSPLTAESRVSKEKSELTPSPNGPQSGEWGNGEAVKEL
jgi:hypothetical protein